MTQFQELLLTVDDHPGGMGYRARKSVAAGEVLAEFPQDFPVVTKDVFSIQIGTATHMHFEEMKYLNHSCDPNVFVNATEQRMVALRDIAPGDELTFFYPATEWEMMNPFDCACGSPRCIGEIGGARSLDAAVLDRYTLNEHIRHLIEKRDNGVEVG